MKCVLITVAALLGACTTSAVASESTGFRSKVIDLADAYVALRVAYDPVLAYPAGIEVEDHSRLPDLSVAARRAFEAREDELRAQLGGIRRDQLENVSERATYAVLKEALEAAHGTRICKSHLWDLSHFTGWQAAFPRLASAQPTSTPELRAQALQRWASLPGYIRAHQENLREGLRSGYAVPRSVVKRVIQQVDGLLAIEMDRSPFLTPAVRERDGTFEGELRKVITGSVNPAIRAFRDFLQNEYLPRARDTLAVSALPDGARCYEALLRANTTLNRSPREVFDLGQATVADNTRAIVEIGRKLFGTDDFAAIIRKSKDAAANRFASAQELLDDSNEILARGLEKSRQLFAELPAQRVILERAPEFQHGTGMMAHYVFEPNNDKPGKYIVPVDEWSTLGRGAMEVAAAHETVPGHHLQLALAYRIGQPTKIGAVADNAAYVEGWSRYAERLAEEAGVYKTDYARIARRVWPARGMVVDPGIHAFGWTRQQAVDYIVSTGNFDAPGAEAIVDRIAVMPGQLTSYDSGGLEIFALRKQAETDLGRRFEIRQFHRQVLEQGAVPLEELRRHIVQWIRETGPR